MFGAEQSRAHVIGGYSGPEPVDKRGMVAHTTKSGEHMQMEAVVLAADQEKEIGGVSIRCAEMDRMARAGQNDERLGEQVGFMVAGMEQSDPPGEGGGTEGFAFREAVQEFPGIGGKPFGFFGEGDHIAQDRGPGFGGEMGIDKTGLDQTFHEVGLGERGFGHFGG